MTFIREEIVRDSIFYWGNLVNDPGMYCSDGCDPFITFLQSTTWYTIGVKIGFLIGILVILLSIVYLVCCAYWAYVDENSDFHVLSLVLDRSCENYCDIYPAEQLWGIIIKEPYYRDCSIGAWSVLGGIIMALSLVWPVIVIYLTVKAPAYLHRAIRRIQKRVDRLEK